jgi:New glue protein family
MAQPEPVSVGDLEVADRIARAVARGGAADRRPTLEQVVAAFGESEPTPDARRRAARALALAGVATVPDLLEALPGHRVMLEVRGTGKRRSPLFGVVALLALLGAAAALAGTLDTSGSDDSVDDLPSGTDAATATQAATTTATTATTVTPTSTTPTTTAKPSAAERRRERRARERRTRERRARALVAARRRVTVRLTASRPTFLCVDGDGRELFNGTLTGSRSFRARVVRLNVGLGPSTRVTANGKPVRLAGSPAGVQITPRRRTVLPVGARPCA